MLKDILGQEIKVGSFIAYAVRWGNSGDMKVGRVVKLTKSVHVKGARRGWNGSMDVNERVGVLPDTSKIVVLADETVPEDIRKLVN